MAEKTKADLLEEITLLETKLDESEARFATSPYATDANYQKEFDRLNKKADKAESELVEIKRRTAVEQAAREQTAIDLKAAEERRAKQFGIENVDQDIHTRFRAMSKPPAGQRDLFGDPATPVFDLRVNLTRYTGGIYLPIATVIEMAQSIGMLTKSQAESLSTELANTNAKVESAGALAQELIDGISSHVDNFYSALSNVVADGDLDDSESGSSESESSEVDGQAPDFDLGTESDGVSGDSDDGQSDSSSNGFFGKLS